MPSLAYAPTRDVTTPPLVTRKSLADATAGLSCSCSKPNCSPDPAPLDCNFTGGGMGVTLPFTYEYCRGHITYLPIHLTVHLSHLLSSSSSSSSCPLSFLISSSSPHFKHPVVPTTNNLLPLPSRAD